MLFHWYIWIINLCFYCQDKYLDMFMRNGYESTLFITKLNENDLKKMGITNRGHVQYLLTQISQLPHFELEYKVPVSLFYFYILNH